MQVGEGQFHAFNLNVNCARGVPTKPGNIEAFEHAQRHQRTYPLSVRADVVQANVAVSRLALAQFAGYAAAPDQTAG